MRILLLCHAFNSLTQRLFVELTGQGHDVSVEFDINDETSIEAVQLFKPELIIAPYLKRAIPEIIWKNTISLIVHPGIIGDRGPSALDWAILTDQKEWGVTVLQANAEMDGGDIWASVNFAMRKATKASLYRNEVTEATVKAIKEAIQKIQQPGSAPLPLEQANAAGQQQPMMQQADRRIDWQRDSTATIIRKVQCADGFPGVKSKLLGSEVYLYDVHPAPGLNGQSGHIIGRNDNAICIATADSAVWIGHLKDKNNRHPFKLPAVQVLGEKIKDVPIINNEDPAGLQPIHYSAQDGIGYLSFNFYNGAMDSEQCLQLQQALIQARQQPTQMIVLLGGEDFWSNGMHLNRIEAAPSAADESWRNINAMDNLALEIIHTDAQLVISALNGNAGAGGVFLARAADEVWARQGIILNPHYKDMGNLYGSEYWTYLLPRHAGEEHAAKISQARLPMGVREAQSLGLVDKAVDVERANWRQQIQQLCKQYTNPGPGQPSIEQRLLHKRQRRAADEASKPLAQYRSEELEKMKRNFYGFDPSYHMARYNFVHKVPRSRTPLTLAKHRRRVQ